MKHIKQYFITGLVFLLPVAVTVAIISFIVNFLTQPFLGVISSLLNHLSTHYPSLDFLASPQVSKYGSKILILLFLFILTLGIGMIMRWLFIRTALNLGDRILHKIPIVNTVYKTSQDIIKTIFVSDKNSFKQVVMVPFPRPGVYAIGLISRESPLICSETAGKSLISVLIPTTPNPTTGFLLMYAKEDLIFIDMKPEDAIKYVVSCGVIIPEHPSASIIV